ncbi:DEAD/DEAH box helicase [Streptacidiphilus sp. PAMC 29251]
MATVYRTAENQPTPPLTGTTVARAAESAAVFLPADPPRESRVAFWRTDGAEPGLGVGTAEQLTVARAHGSGARRRTVPAELLTIAEALPLLTRARAQIRSGSSYGSGNGGDVADDSVAFWGGVALFGLQLVARGRLLPGLSPADHDAWRVGPLDVGDVTRLRELAAAMPPEARAVPLAELTPLHLPDADVLVRAFLDAVADCLPRSPGAVAATGQRAFAAVEPQQLPEQRGWATELATGVDAGVRVSLRVELPGLEFPSEEAQEAEAEEWDDDSWTESPFRAVVQVHSLADPTLFADAGALWSGSAPAEFGARTRIDTLLTLRRAARVWPALTRLLAGPVPDQLQLADDEVEALLTDAAEQLAAVGVAVHWPKELARELTATAVVEPAERVGSAAPSLLSAAALLNFRWQLSVGDRELTEAELERLAEAQRPVIRLRDQWVLVDPALIRRARNRAGPAVQPLAALAAALTGSAEIDGELVPVAPTGWLAALRERLADPEGGAGQEPVRQPEALAATLRDYQLRGLSWLDRMTGLGLGVCLADDMGLGKTITVIALHLHHHQKQIHQKQGQQDPAGPTLVVCPASLLGNWQREIERFAPGTPVHRYHGAARDLSGLEPDAFVLTTYGTMRRDAKRLAGSTAWGLLVADEAQHVKNPFSATAKALRTIPSGSRVALSGTPVENNLSELWALLDWTTPGLLGTLPAFRDRYARPVEGDADLATAERLSALIRPFLLRRRKSDPGIAPELPPKTETDNTVSLTKEQVALYEAVVRETMTAIEAADGIARRGLIVKLLTGLKQICNHPAQYLKESAGTRLDGRSGKLELLDELLDTILAEGASVLVFTQYVAMARLIERHLAERGVGSLFLHGGTPVKRREEMVAAFQDGGTPVFLLSLKAAGTGLNLTRAEHVIHFDRWWNPAVEDQATDRAYRIGQTRPVQVHKLITEGTVEDRIAEMLRRKRDLADAVLTGGEASFTELSNAELAELVTLQRGA